MRKTNSRTTAEITIDSRRIGPYKNVAVPGGPIALARDEWKPGSRFPDSKGNLYQVAIGGNLVKL